MLDVNCDEKIFEEQKRLLWCYRSSSTVTEVTRLTKSLVHCIMFFFHFILRDSVHFIDEDNIVTYVYFDSCITFDHGNVNRELKKTQIL